MRFFALAAAVAAVSRTAAQCDQEYECEYKTTDVFRYFYDVKPLCHLGIPDVYTTPDGTEYAFNICGNVNMECTPPYTVEFERGVVIQYFGDAPLPNSTCTNKAGNQVQCTRDCEVLGVGTPIITVMDPSHSGNGINITHYGVPSLPESPFQCPFNPSTGAPDERQVTISLSCNPTAVLRPVVTWAGEVAPCQYLIQMQSKYGCGCQPNCYGRNCGSDGCGGYCGGIGQGGGCPNDGVTQCTDGGVCCAPDCRGRSCGDDGCGGSCGQCTGSSLCNRYQQCFNPNNQPSPLPPPATVVVSTTTGGDKFAAFAGGAIAAGVITTVVLWVMRLRSA